MKRRIKKDNDRRELLNIPVPESEVVEVAESDTEEGKDDKTKDEGNKPEHHARRDDRSPDRRRTPPRRRASPYRPYVAPVSSPSWNRLLSSNPCCPVHIFLFFHF